MIAALLLLPLVAAPDQAGQRWRRSGELGQARREPGPPRGRAPWDPSDEASEDSGDRTDDRVGSHVIAHAATAACRPRAAPGIATVLRLPGGTAARAR